jgi:hypothetical protein
MCLRSRQLITWRPDGTRARMVIVFYKHIVPTGRKRMGSTSRPNRVETRHTQLVFLSQRDNMFVANVPALRPPPRMGGMLTGTVVNYECHPEPYVSNNTAALPFREMSFVTCLRSRQLITWRPDGTRARMVTSFSTNISFLQDENAWTQHLVPTNRKRDIYKLTIRADIIFAPAGQYVCSTRPPLREPAP